MRPILDDPYTDETLLRPTAFAPMCTIRPPSSAPLLLPPANAQHVDLDKCVWKLVWALWAPTDACPDTPWTLADVRPTVNQWSTKLGV